MSDGKQGWIGIVKVLDTIPLDLLHCVGHKCTIIAMVNCIHLSRYMFPLPVLISLTLDSFKSTMHIAI